MVVPDVLVLDMRQDPAVPFVVCLPFTGYFSSRNSGAGRLIEEMPR
jgi:hypothetical protein